MNPFALFTNPKALIGTLSLRFFSLRKIPLILFLRPSIVTISGERVVLKIPLRRRTKNQLGTMYFGALTTGADVAGAVMALEAIRISGQPVQLVFKDMHAQFLKRAEGDTHFTCSDGILIQDLIEKALETGMREELPVEVIATVPTKLGDEAVAKFTLTLSVKLSGKAAGKARDGRPARRAAPGKAKKRRTAPSKAKAKTKPHPKKP